jgi:hypothetical protein
MTRAIVAILGGWGLLLGVPFNVAMTIWIAGIVPAPGELVAGALSCALWLWVLVRDGPATQGHLAAHPANFAAWSAVAWGVAGAANTAIAYLLLYGRVDGTGLVAALLTAVLLGPTIFGGTRVLAARMRTGEP